MAQLIWTAPALQDLDTIADYIALDNPEAARRLVRRVFNHVEQLMQHPESGSRPAELPKSRYRQIVEPPCRVFYRFGRQTDEIFVLYVMRGEMRLRRAKLKGRDRSLEP